MPTNITFFLPHLNAGGVEKVVLNLIIHLDRTQFSPSLILSKKEGTLLPLVPQDVTIIDFGGTQMSKSISKLRAFIVAENIDVIYGGTNAANITASIACLTLRNRPLLLISEHTPPSLFLENAKWKFFRTLAMKLLYPIADSIITPTDLVANELREILKSPNIPTKTLPNPLIDTQLIDDSCLKIPISFTPIKLISAGRLVKIKGFDILIDAVKKLTQQNIDIHLTILGEGPERAALEQQLKKLGLTSNITLPGAVTNPVDHFMKASIFVLSSHREGFGNVLIEAMSSGIPVISSDCPVGPRHILKNGQAGILIPPNDAMALCNAIIKLSSNPDLVNKLRAQGLERARDFSIDSAVLDFQTCIKKLCEAS